MFVMQQFVFFVPVLELKEDVTSLFGLHSDNTAKAWLSFQIHTHTHTDDDFKPLDSAAGSEVLLPLQVLNGSTSAKKKASIYRDICLKCLKTKY